MVSGSEVGHRAIVRVASVGGSVVASDWCQQAGVELRSRRLPMADAGYVTNADLAELTEDPEAAIRMQMSQGLRKYVVRGVDDDAQDTSEESR